MPVRMDMLGQAGAPDSAGAAGISVGAAATAAAADLPPRILNITAPQVGHLPFTALRPFFIVSSTASVIGFFALQRTQYPSAMTYPVVLASPGQTVQISREVESPGRGCQFSARRSADNRLARRG